MKGDHFLFQVLAGKMELCAQGQSSFQEMTCSPAHNGKTHKVHLAINEQTLSSTNGTGKDTWKMEGAGRKRFSLHLDIHNDIS